MSATSGRMTIGSRAGALCALLTAMLAVSVFGDAPAEAASTTPAWSIETIPTPTDFAPGGSSPAYYETLAVDEGGAPVDGSPIELIDTLPRGLTVTSVELPLYFQGVGKADVGALVCTTEASGEAQTVRCPIEAELFGLVPDRNTLRLLVNVSAPAGASGELTNVTEVRGGGAPPASTAASNPVSTTPATSGVHAFRTEATDARGVIEAQSAAVPYAYTTSFDLNSTLSNFGGPIPAGGNAKDIRVALPPGLVGNPTATPRCTAQQFDTIVGAGENLTRECPDGSAVGTITLRLESGGRVFLPVYSIVPPPGMPAQFAFAVGTTAFFINTAIRTGTDYGITASVENAAGIERFTAARITLWGNPADPSHDRVRGNCFGTIGESLGSCPFGGASKPFLRLPTACGPLETGFAFDTYRAPETQLTSSFGSPPLANCERLDFSPEVSVQPTSAAAESPTALNVDIRVPQAGLTSPAGAAEADLRRAVVTLPVGMSVNPASATGLGACAPTQVGLLGAGFAEPDSIHFTPGPAICPDAAKIGTVEVKTPLLEEPLQGGVYLAQQRSNPFGSLLAIYLAVTDSKTGVVLKLPGKVEADPVSGQVSATFDDNPQLPFEELHVELFGGPRAALMTPPSCGTYASQTSLAPWSGTPALQRSSSFQITSGPDGAPCPNGGFDPQLSAGTTNPIAGSYSPFALNLSRADGTQQLSTISVQLPEGLLGKLKGIPYCSDADLAAVSEAEGTAAAQAAAPSCPAASQVGTVTVGAGAGPDPFYASGRAYLAGPYKGAPLSLAIVTPAVAGPFDLGTVVVRTALYVDEATTQIHAVSDPIPTILDGIPLDVRSIALNMNRPNFTLNPTSCNAMQVLGAATSTLGNVVQLQNRFQVGACGALGFKPGLSLSLKGGTKRNRHPALRSIINYPTKGAYANIAKAAVTLPASEFIDQAHIGNPCIRPVFAEEKCPKISVLGRAKAWTPLLDQPEEGKVYFRSNGGERELPDLVVALKGQIPLTLVGFVDAVHHKGSEVSRLRTTFATVPDAPVSRFILELKGGKEGLLVNSGNLCKIPNKAVVKLTAQNGKTYDTQPAVANDCGKGKSGKGKKKGRHHH